MQWGPPVDDMELNWEWLPIAIANTSTNQIETSLWTGMAENGAEGAVQPEEPQQEAPQPKETLYVNNLNEKIKIEGNTLHPRIRGHRLWSDLFALWLWRKDLKKELYDLFSQHGTVLEVVAIKTYSLRGQAWIVFNSIEEAGVAMEKLNETDFHEKPLVSHFSSCLFSSMVLIILM